MRANAAHQEILPCATFAPGRLLYTYSVYRVRNWHARRHFAMRNAVPITYKNWGTNSVCSSRRRAIMPPRRSARRINTHDKNPQENALGHAICARFALSPTPTASCPLLVAHAPHKVASVARAGIFLSLQGNDMAKCQRTNLDIARSLYNAFCSVGNVILRAMYDLSSSTGSQ
jgi:hypothetical protein